MNSLNDIDTIVLAAFSIFHALLVMIVKVGLAALVYIMIIINSYIYVYRHFSVV